MAISRQSKARNSLDKQIPLEEMKELLIDYAGSVTAISKKLGCSRTSIYNYFEKFPELRDIQKKADVWHGEAELDTSYHVLDKLLQDADENPATAFQSAKLIVTRNKRSRYYEKEKDSESENPISAAIAAMSAKLEEQEKELDSLRSKRGN